MSKSPIWHLVKALYWWACIGFWIAYFYFGFFVYHDPARFLRESTDSVINLGSTTDDPVTLLMVVLIVVAGVILLPGVMFVGLCLIGVATVLAFVSFALLLVISLFRVSPIAGGVAIVILGGLMCICVKSAGSPIWRWLRRIVNVLFALGGEQPTHGAVSQNSPAFNQQSSGSRRPSQTRPLGRGNPDWFWGIWDDILPEDSEHRAESHAAAYKAGVDEARKSTLVDDFFHGFGEMISTVVPFQDSKQQSREAGWRDEKSGKTKKK